MTYVLKTERDVAPSEDDAGSVRSGAGPGSPPNAGTPLAPAQSSLPSIVSAVLRAGRLKTFPTAKEVLAQRGRSTGPGSRSQLGTALGGGVSSKPDRVELGPPFPPPSLRGRKNAASGRATVCLFPPTRDSSGC